MIQPKYSPQEALEKIKLRMKDDLSKTLNDVEPLTYIQPALLVLFQASTYASFQSFEPYSNELQHAMPLI